MKQIIYIASPYGRKRGETPEQIEDNLMWAISYARLLIKLGHVPFVPHLYHYVHLNWSLTPSEDVWLEICKTFIPFCDAVLRLGGTSMGADQEVELALSLGKKIYYSVEDL